MLRHIGTMQSFVRVRLALHIRQLLHFSKKQRRPTTPRNTREFYFSVYVIMSCPALRLVGPFGPSSSLIRIVPASRFVYPRVLAETCRSHACILITVSAKEALRPFHKASMFAVFIGVV